MTAEDKNAFCKELIKWSKTDSASEYRYMEERIYAVKVGDGMVTLVEADNPHDAVTKARQRVTMTMNGSGGTQIGYVQSLTLQEG